MILKQVNTMEKGNGAVGWRIRKDGRLLPELFNSKEKAEEFAEKDKGAEVIEYFRIGDIHPGVTYPED